ncbi:unnamed protein product [Lymnaea stagnalis]|uniref:Uncharacterized protein n=1 Tax=Lymnaea stagnalis TaxID=6523 RepID=A0AAV2H604_LYMST
MEEVNISEGNYDRDSHFKESEFLPNFNQPPARGTTGHPRDVSHSREHQGGSVDTQYSTLRSETIPRSPVTSDDDRMVYLEDMTPYSTLRSEPLAKSPYRYDTSGKGKSHRSKSSYQEHELTHDLTHDSHQTKKDVYRHPPRENIYSSTHRPKISEPQRLDNEIITDSFHSALSQSQKSLTPHSSKETHPKAKKQQTFHQRTDFSQHEDHIPTCPTRSRDRRYLDNTNRDGHYSDKTNRDRHYSDSTNTLIQRDDILVEPSSSSYPDRISNFQHTDHYDQHHSGFYSNQYQGTSRRYQFKDSDLAHLDFYKIKSNDRTREKPPYSPGHHHDNSRYTVKFDDNVTTDSPQNPRQSLDSQFFNGLSTLQSHSSPLCTSDTSFSRRATKGSTDNENISQRDFFQGTEFSESLSSISDTDQANPSFNNNGLSSMDDNAFTTGIAALDEKIANLQQKINRTKSIFS